MDKHNLDNTGAKDHEIRTRRKIAKIVKNEDDVPEYFREQAGYYRRKKLKNDLLIAADIIQMLQEQNKEYQNAQ